jgi:hypothetical protein
MGAHLDFLDGAGSGRVIRPRDLKEYHCAFRDRLGGPWPYVDDLSEAVGRVVDAVRLWQTEGRAFFDRYSVYPESFRRLVLELPDDDVGAGEALKYGRVALAVGEKKRAAALVRLGIERLEASCHWSTGDRLNTALQKLLHECGAA